MATRELELSDHILGVDSLLREYASCESIMKSGFYVLPDTLDLFVWHGVVMPHDGPYEGGIFRFVMCIDPRFPEGDVMPRIFFIEKPYHPLVDKKTGTFQFLPEVVEKFSRSHRLCDALAAVRSSMLSLSVVADTKGKIYDASTFKEFKHSPVEFARKAADSARAAREAAVAVAPEFFPISSIDEKPEVSARVWQRLPAWRVHELTDKGEFTPKLTELAEAAISIGRRRGFRMSEPTQAHIDLATHLVQESVASHDAVMHVLRGAAETADPRPKPHVHVMPTPLG